MLADLMKYTQEAFANDEEFQTFCTEKLGGKVKFFFGIDPADPPPESDFPLIIMEGIGVPFEVGESGNAFSPALGIELWFSTGAELLKLSETVSVLPGIPLADEAGFHIQRIIKKCWQNYDIAGLSVGIDDYVIHPQYCVAALFRLSIQQTFNNKDFYHIAP